MSSRGLKLPCPHCNDDGPFHLVKQGDWPESENCKTFAWGYKCWMCNGHWEAREQDKLDHPEEFEVRE